MQRRAGHPVPSDASWVPATSGGDLQGPRTCISSSGHLSSEAGGLRVLGSTEDHLFPSEILGVSLPQVTASCLVPPPPQPPLPAFLGFCAMGFAGNGLWLESKTPHKTCFLDGAWKQKDTQIWVSVICSNFPPVHSVYRLTETVRNPRAAAGPRGCHAQLRAYVSLERSPRLSCLSL